MDNDVLVFAQVMAVLLSSVAVLTGIFFVARFLWKSSAQPRQQRLPAMDDSRLERIENAVDAIAIEVERISEAQRFSASLLSDRLPARQGDRVPELGQPGAGKRTNTPH